MRGCKSPQPLFEKEGSIETPPSPKGVGGIWFPCFWTGRGDSCKGERPFAPTGFPPAREWRRNLAAFKSWEFDLDRGYNLSQRIPFFELSLSLILKAWKVFAIFFSCNMRVSHLSQQGNKIYRASKVKTWEIDSFFPVGPCNDSNFWYIIPIANLQAFKTF